MEIITSIPAGLESDEIGRLLRIRPDRADLSLLEELSRLAGSLINPRAVYSICYVGKRDDQGVEVGGLFFRSRVLRRNLDRAQKVFPYVMTIGPALEQTAASQGDLLKQYYLEEIANFVLEKGVTWLADMLKSRWGFASLSNMSPGSLEDRPLTEQGKLFSLFTDTEKAIGVKLTDRFLMLPRKSLSGILFPSEETFTACRLCPREKCPSRRAEYDEVLAAGYQKT